MTTNRYLYIRTSGQRNIKHPISPGHSAGEIISNIRACNGLWDNDMYFPYHSMVQFEIREETILNA